MCGVLGFIANEGINEKLDLFRFSLNEMSYRGPDSSGVWEGNHALIGHNRLSIIDTSDNGKQPMHFHDRYVLTFNGEIYNFELIKADLIGLGYTFYSSSDSEVLLYAYVEWKEFCLEKFNGMFAFGVWDRVERKLFIARDRVGQKPLFYTLNNNVFGFSSEMKGLYGLLNRIKPNNSVLKKVLEPAQRGGDNGVFNYEYTSQCIVEGINRLEAGSYLIYNLDDQSINKRTYWKLLEDKMDVPKSYKDQVQMFKELFLDSCKLRQRSDVPTATALSGGVDSSSIIGSYAYLRDNDLLINDKHKAFIANMKGSVVDEAEYALKTVKALGVDYEIIDVDPLNGIDDIFNILYKFEEIYLANPLPMINTYNKMYDQGYRVSIDGHGADELFGGYEDNLYAILVDFAPNYFKIKKGLKEIRAVSGHGVKPGETISFFKHAIKNKYFGSDQDGAYYYPRYEGLDYLNSILYKNVMKHGIPTLLRNYDRYSMISSVEVRCPFIDPRLIHFAFSIEGKSKFMNGYSKSIIRDAMADIVPKDVMYRKHKTGFHPPMDVWLKNELKEWFLDQINSSEILDSEFIDGMLLRLESNNFLKDEKSSLVADLWEKFLIYGWEKSLKIASKKFAKYM